MLLKLKVMKLWVMFVDVKGDDVRIQDVESWCCWLKVLRVWDMEVDVGETDVESSASEVVETLCC